MENNRYQYHLKKIFSLAAFMLISCVVIAQKRLVGATSYGGDQFGTIFSIDAGGAAFFSQLNLEGNPGFNPYDKMVEAANGKLYGTTNLGGNYQGGVLFEYDYNTGVYTKKIDFDGDNNGINPDVALLKASNGKLYGTTTYGGPAGCGVLFEYDVNTAQLTTKIAFSELDNRGAFPTGSLVQAANGKLYGQATTPDGTAGIIYEYDPITDTYTRKFDLPAGTFFGTNAMAEAPDGNLYGITAYGGLNNAGFIFSYNFTGNVFNVVFDMATTTGSTSLGPMLLAANGKFYGTTNTGGTNNAGVIFEYDYVTNNYTDKIDLLPATGSEPWGSLTVFTNGKLYGHTRSGGASNNGVLFEYDYTTNTYTKKIDMEFASGAGPQGSLTVANNGKLYGITPYGGLEAGVIFEYDQPSNTYVKKIDIGTSLNGARPTGALAPGGNGKLYGLTSQGGINNLGTVYAYDYLANTYEKKFDLSITNGNLPAAGLMKAANGKMYGCLQLGGLNNAGVIFEFDINTNTYTKKIDLQPADGSRPRCTLLETPGGKLYGLTTEGGLNNKGVIFEYDYTTNSYSKKFDFTAATGSPVGLSLALAANGKLYGSTTVDNANGTIFEYDYTTNTYTPKVNLTTSDGLLAKDPMIEAPNGKLYGIASSGGLNGTGVIFEYDYIANSYTKKIDLSALTGSAASGAFVLSSDNGKLYAITGQGGANLLGGVLEYDYINNIATLVNDFTYTSGYFPNFSSLLEVDFSIVPVTLLNLRVNKSGNDALLYWETSNEINADRIEIERSPDGSNFSFLNSVQAKGNSAAINRYFFMDNHVLPGNNFYRLKMIDNDGKFAFSDIRNVLFDQKTSVIVYPNPIHAQLNIAFAGNYINQPVKITLYNLLRQPVWELQLQHANPTEHFSMEKIANGFYVMEVKSSDNSVMHQKIQILH